MKKTIKLSMPVFIILSMLLIASAKPIVQSSTNGIEIQYPKLDTFKLNTAAELNFHAFNVSNGVIRTNATTSCNFHLYDDDGDHIFGQKNISYHGDYDFYVSIPASNFSSIGAYGYLISCNSTLGNLGGYVSVPITVTETGETFNEFQGYFLLGTASIMIIFLVLGFSFSPEKWKIRTFFFMLSIAVSVIMFNSLRVAAEGSATLANMAKVGLTITIVALSIMALYVLIYYTIDVLNTLKDKKRMKWDLKEDVYE